MKLKLRLCVIWVTVCFLISAVVYVAPGDVDTGFNAGAFLYIRQILQAFGRLLFKWTGAFWSAAYFTSTTTFQFWCSSTLTVRSITALTSEFQINPFWCLPFRRTDGSRITFTINWDSLPNFGIYRMNSGGSNPTRLTSNTALDFATNW